MVALVTSNGGGFARKFRRSATSHCQSLLACSGMSGGTREFYLKPSDIHQEKRFFTPENSIIEALVALIGSLPPGAAPCAGPTG